MNWLSAIGGRVRVRFGVQAAARALMYISVVVVGLLAGTALNAQPSEDIDVVPPPAKVVSAVEATRLKAETDVKGRTELALELMSARLVKAEGHFAREEFDAMFVELGVFHALVDDTMVYLNRSDRNRDRVLNNFKRFEIGLRRFAPRIELLRRDVPAEYDPYLRSLAVHVRRTRSKAVEPLFDVPAGPANRPSPNQ